jgi:hypothetical protein
VIRVNTTESRPKACLNRLLQQNLPTCDIRYACLRFGADPILERRNFGIAVSSELSRSRKVDLRSGQRPSP